MDAGLVPSLTSGVSTGVLKPLTPSGRWPASNSEAALGPCLDWCEGNWASASWDPDTLLILVEHEAADVSVCKLEGTVDYAKLRCPHGVAKGKLGVARSVGRDDRLLSGTTISG